MKAVLFAIGDPVRITGNSRDYGAHNLAQYQGETGQIVRFQEASYVVRLDGGPEVKVQAQDLQLAVS